MMTSGVRQVTGTLAARGSPGVVDMDIPLLVACRGELINAFA